MSLLCISADSAKNQSAVHVCVVFILIRLRCLIASFSFCRNWSKESAWADEIIMKWLTMRWRQTPFFLWPDKIMFMQTSSCVYVVCGPVVFAGLLTLLTSLTCCADLVWPTWSARDLWPDRNSNMSVRSHSLHLLWVITISTFQPCIRF